MGEPRTASVGTCDGRIPEHAAEHIVIDGYRQAIYPLRLCVEDTSMVMLKYSRMAYLPSIKRQARERRAKGESLQSIAGSLGISQSTVSVWVRDVRIPKSLPRVLLENSEAGRRKGRAVIAATRDQLKLQREQKAALAARAFVQQPSPEFWQLVAALLFWCEGGKRELSTLHFANSDPQLVRTFLRALRIGFSIDESKFRVVLHLHGYHDEIVQRKFWSKVTRIPDRLFQKSYKKPNSGTRKRDGYQGCVSVRYNDAGLARFLDALYHAVGNEIVGA